MIAQHVIAILKAKETFFSLLIQIHEYLIFFVYVLHKLRRSSLIFKLLKAPRCPKHVARMDILSKLEVCLPPAYPSTIYKHFSSLMPLKNTNENDVSPNYEGKKYCRDL